MMLSSPESMRNRVEKKPEHMTIIPQAAGGKSNLSERDDTSCTSDWRVDRLPIEIQKA